MKYTIFYKEEKLGEVSKEEALKINENLMSKERTLHINIGGETLKKSLITIRKTGYIKAEEVDTEKIKMLEEIKKERVSLKEQTPTEKTFRNYKCIFTWRYLLQYGFSRFFETEDWKNESSYDTFKRFDKLIWERKPDLMRKFTETLEKYFTENPEEIWCDRKSLTSFLPNGDTASKDILIKKMFVNN